VLNGDMVNNMKRNFFQLEYFNNVSNLNFLSSKHVEKKNTGIFLASFYLKKLNDFGVKLNLHISKTVDNFQTTFLLGIPFAIVCIKGKRGLCHV
jgi:hypothetical protein